MRGLEYRCGKAELRRAVANFLQDIENSLSYLHIPLKELHHRSKLKTVNKLESFFRSLRRRINKLGTLKI